MLLWSTGLLPFATLCFLKDPSTLSRPASRGSCTLAAESNPNTEESLRPISLLEKAKEIDCSLAGDNPLDEYSESMWSNR